ncbi:MAG: hypothetical protein PVJ36_04675 [Nitrospirota bacterium]|jgi:hypothetical protein
MTKEETVNIITKSHVWEALSAGEKLEAIAHALEIWDENVTLKLSEGPKNGHIFT